jgi:hypothetical protein
MSEIVDVDRGICSPYMVHTSTAPTCGRGSGLLWKRVGAAGAPGSISPCQRSRSFGRWRRGSISLRKAGTT